MKKIIAIILTTVLMLSCFSMVTSAKVGDVIGYALHTDIVAYINNYAIPSYAVNGQSVIVAEDLRNFGFDVAWDGYNRTLTIARNGSPWVTPMNFSKDSVPNTMFANLLQTDIKVYANGIQIPSYAINGYTMIPMEALTMLGEIYWVAGERALKMWVDGLYIRETKQNIALIQNYTVSRGADNIASKKLIMATNATFPPYEFKEGEDIVGIDVEIAQAIADKLDMELVIEDMEFDSIIIAVTNDESYVGIAGLTVTDERKVEVNFSDIYAANIQVVIVKEGSDIKNLDGLADKKIGVQLGTTGDIYASGDYGDENVIRYGKGADAIIALQDGDIDAVIIDNEPAQTFVANNEGLTILETEYAVEGYAIAVNKNNPDLLKKINGALVELSAEGKLDEIIKKYAPIKH